MHQRRTAAASQPCRSVTRRSTIYPTHYRNRNLFDGGMSHFTNQPAPPWIAMVYNYNFYSSLIAGCLTACLPSIIISGWPRSPETMFDNLCLWWLGWLVRLEVDVCTIHKLCRRHRRTNEPDGRLRVWPSPARCCHWCSGLLESFVFRFDIDAGARVLLCWCCCLTRRIYLMSIWAESVDNRRLYRRFYFQAKRRVALVRWENLEHW